MLYNKKPAFLDGGVIYTSEQQTGSLEIQNSIHLRLSNPAIVFFFFFLLQEWCSVTYVLNIWLNTCENLKVKENKNHIFKFYKWRKCLGHVLIIPFTQISFTVIGNQGPVVQS